MHLDSATGPIVGTVDCPVTDGWQNWVTVNGKVSGAEGKHDLFLRFSGGDSYLFNVDWWQFVENGDTDSHPGQIVDEFGGVVTQNKDSGILGDYNGDGIINAADLSFAKMLMLKGETNRNTIKPADVDVNRVIENKDGDLA